MAKLRKGNAPAITKGRISRWLLYRFTLLPASGNIISNADTILPSVYQLIDGKICMEFAPSDDAAFFRFSVQ